MNMGQKLVSPELSIGRREVVSTKTDDFSMRWAFGPSRAATSSKLRLADDTHHRQKSHITSTRTSLWFEGGCWGDGKAQGGEENYRREAGSICKILGRYEYHHPFQLQRGPTDIFNAVSSENAEFAIHVPSEVPARRKPIPMTSTDEEEEERETKERETCSKGGGEGGRRITAGLFSNHNTHQNDGRRRER